MSEWEGREVWQWLRWVQDSGWHSDCCALSCDVTPSCWAHGQRCGLGSWSPAGSAFKHIHLIGCKFSVQAGEQSRSKRMGLAAYLGYPYLRKIGSPCTSLTPISFCGFVPEKNFKLNVLGLVFLHHSKRSLRKQLQRESFFSFFFFWCFKLNHRTDRCVICVVLSKALWSRGRPWPWRYLAWVSRCGSHQGGCQALSAETLWEERFFSLQKGKQTSHSPFPPAATVFILHHQRWHTIWWISSFFFFYTHLNYYININS